MTESKSNLLDLSSVPDQPDKFGLVPDSDQNGWILPDEVAYSYYAMTRNPDTNPYEHFVTFPAMRNRIPNEGVDWLLDVGCSTGEFTLHYAASAQFIVGVDIDIRAIEYANDTASSSTHGPEEIYITPHSDSRFWHPDLPAKPNYFPYRNKEIMDVIAMKMSIDFFSRKNKVHMRQLRDTVTAARYGALLVAAIYHPIIQRKLHRLAGS